MWYKKRKWWKRQASPPQSCYFMVWGESNAAAVVQLEGEAECRCDDCGLVSNSTDQMTLQWKSPSAGRNLKIEMTTPTIKALWSPGLVFKWLVILLLYSELAKDCSLKRLYYFLHLKPLSKFNNKSLSRCESCLNVGNQFHVCTGWAFSWAFFSRFLWK